MDRRSLALNTLRLHRVHEDTKYELSLNLKIARDLNIANLPELLRPLTQ